MNLKLNFKIFLLYFKSGRTEVVCEVVLKEAPMVEKEPDILPST